MPHSTDMATPDTHGLIQPPDDQSVEVLRAQQLAARYRREFVDMNEFRIDQELFRSIPADLMLRYGFVPYRRAGRSLVIVVSDPTDLPMIDELSAILTDRKSTRLNSSHLVISYVVFCITYKRDRKKL